MGTSVKMIDRNYGSLARDSVDHALAKLNGIASPEKARRTLRAVA